MFDLVYQAHFSGGWEMVWLDRLCSIVLLMSLYSKIHFAVVYVSIISQSSRLTMHEAEIEELSDNSLGPTELYYAATGTVTFLIATYIAFPLNHSQQILVFFQLFQNYTHYLLIIWKLRSLLKPKQLWLWRRTPLRVWWICGSNTLPYSNTILLQHYAWLEHFTLLSKEAQLKGETL